MFSLKNNSTIVLQTVCPTHLFCHFVRPSDYTLTWSVSFQGRRCYGRMSHVARRFQFFSGHELMSTFQCNCNSRATCLVRVVINLDQACVYQSLEQLCPTGLYQTWCHYCLTTMISSWYNTVTSIVPILNFWLCMKAWEICIIFAQLYLRNG